MPLIFDDVTNLQIENLHVPASKEMPVILLNQVKGYRLKELRLPKTENEAIIFQ